LAPAPRGFISQVKIQDTAVLLSPGPGDIAPPQELGLPCTTVMTGARSDLNRLD